MRKSERWELILTELRWKPHVRAAELADQFGVSGETIRRDLQALSKAGQIDRAYGGASVRYPGARPSLDQRKAERVEERDRIAQSAAALIADGETLMIDAGSTTIAFARRLALSGLAVRVLTNSVQVAMIAGQSPSIELRLCPGEFVHREGATVGPDTLDYIARHNVAVCVLGASALHEGGVSETVPGFAQVKRAMLARAGRAVFLIDHSKFGRADLDQVAAPGPGRLICVDRMPGPAIAAAWTGRGGEILVAEAGDG